MGYSFLGASFVAQLVKNLSAVWETWVQSLCWEDWRRERLPTSVFLPGEFHGLYSLWGHIESETRLSDFHFDFHFFPGCLKSYHRAWRRDARKLDCPRLPALGCGERCGPSRAIILSKPVHLGLKEDKEFLETLGNVRDCCIDQSSFVLYFSGN